VYLVRLRSFPLEAKQHASVNDDHCSPEKLKHTAALKRRVGVASHSGRGARPLHYPRHTEALAFLLVLRRRCQVRAVFLTLADDMHPMTSHFEGTQIDCSTDIVCSGRLEAPHRRRPLVWTYVVRVQRFEISQCTMCCHDKNGADPLLDKFGRAVDATGTVHAGSVFV
jgi:hypothetical protein